jgi:hypothetical protein
MSTPAATSGSQAVVVSQSLVSRSRLASGSATPPSDVATPPSSSVAPATESATVGNNNVVEIEDDVPVGCKRKLRSEVWKDFDLVKVKGVWKARCK